LSFFNVLAKIFANKLLALVRICYLSIKHKIKKPSKRQVFNIVYSKSKLYPQHQFSDSKINNNSYNVITGGNKRSGS
jgi:hypothetical protein